MSLVLAIVMWFVILAPEWIAVLLGAKYLVRLREAVKRRCWWMLLASSALLGAMLIAVVGTVWVCKDLLGPERMTAQFIVWYGTLADQVLLLLMVILLSSRRRAGESGAAP
jgi:hypothetical protein